MPCILDLKRCSWRRGSDHRHKKGQRDWAGTMYDGLEKEAGGKGERQVGKAVGGNGRVAYRSPVTSSAAI